MIITYLRSSSYGTHNMCEQQYFIEYNLGLRSPSNQKANKGTIVHKVMEILADISVAVSKGQPTIEDEICGEINVFDHNVEKITDQVYEYYTSRFIHHQWKPLDLKHCKKWVEKTITVQNCNFDPRNQNIIQPEQRFDIEIKKPWAHYKYSEDLEGYLAIKGTIDLIAQPNPNTIEIIDYKTGKRLDWATGEEKTFKKLEKDPQLRMYHYAASVLYPEIEHVIVSIYFINDGGIFSMNYNKSQIHETEDMIRRKFQEIKSCTRPRLNKTWKCSKLCHFGKNYFPNPEIEYRDGQRTPHGLPMTICEEIKYSIDLLGMKGTVDKYQQEGYNVGKYKAPGTTE